MAPTGNIQEGTVKVPDLNTGKVERPKTSTKVPMPDSVVELVNDWGKRYQKTERKESIKFRNRNKEKYTWDNNEYEDDQMVIENDCAHAGTPEEFPGIDIDNEDDRPAIELLDDTDEECVLMAAKEAGISTQCTDIEGVTTAIDLVDKNNSDSDDESEIQSLIDPDSSDDKDSDENNDDDADGDENVINHILVSENTNVGRQERVKQDVEGVINHISVSENANLSRQETVTPETNTNVTLGGRTQIVSPATAGFTSTAVEHQLARGHTFDDKGRQRTTRKSKKPKNYEPNYTNTNCTLKVLSTSTWIR